MCLPDLQSLFTMSVVMIIPNCTTDEEYSRYINIWLVCWAIQHVKCSIEKKKITRNVVHISDGIKEEWPIVWIVHCPWYMCPVISSRCEFDFIQVHHNNIFYSTKYSEWRKIINYRHYSRHFTTSKRALDENLEKIVFAIMLFIFHHFAHVRIAQLSWQVHNCGLFDY